MSFDVSEGGLEGLLPSPRAVHRRSRAMATSSVTSTISRLTGKVEWLGQISDALLAQSVIDRLKSAAYEVVLGGESYRQHETRAPGSNRRAQATPTLLTHRAPPRSSPPPHWSTG